MIKSITSRIKINIVIQLAGKAGWEDAAGKIESVLREEYAEQWFELSWQKKQAVLDI